MHHHAINVIIIITTTTQDIHLTDCNPHHVHIYFTHLYANDGAISTHAKQYNTKKARPNPNMIQPSVIIYLPRPSLSIG